MQKKTLFINAIMTAVYVIVNAVILFILYRFALSIVGVERLGVWSLILATASFGTIFQLGFSTSVIKFVAKYIALKDNLAVAKIIETTVIIISSFHFFLLACLYPLGKLVLQRLIQGEFLNEGILVLPYVLLALWMFLIGYIYQAALDGYQLNAIRKLLLVFASIIQLTVAYFYIPVVGIIGLAYAQIAQSFVTLLGSNLLLKRQLPILHIIPRRWSPHTFKELITYSLSLQAMSIFQMIIDPVTKALLTKFGGLAMTGYYDLACRLVFQLREMLVLSTEVMLPAVATLAEINRDAIEKLYLDAYSLNVFLSVPCYSLLVISAPLISIVWLGSYQATFVTFSTIIAFGWFFNTISSPAKVVQIGLSQLKWVVIASGTLSLLNLVLGYIGGLFYGGQFVVIALAISHFVSGVIVMLAYHLQNKTSLKLLVATEHLWLVLSAVLAFSFYFEMFFGGYNIKLQPLYLAIFVSGFGFLVISIFAWLHPVRVRLTNYAAYQLLKWRA